MNKEELEKEAYEYFKSICGDYNEEYERTGKRHYWVGFDIKNAYLAGAEPREKQIQIDAEQIRALQKQNGELTDRVKELEAQIEKMKCCENCSKNGHICVAEEMQGKLCGKNKDKWELRR